MRDLLNILGKIDLGFIIVILIFLAAHLLTGYEFIEYFMYYMLAVFTTLNLGFLVMIYFESKENN